MARKIGVVVHSLLICAIYVNIYMIAVCCSPVLLFQWFIFMATV